MLLNRFQNAIINVTSPHLAKTCEKNDSIFSFEQVIGNGVARKGQMGHTHWAQVFGVHHLLSQY